MPVCSYFLKGICNNSNCPYSHVYVSRKAEICQDFLKGYCPMGEKVKRGPSSWVPGLDAPLLKPQVVFHMSCGTEAAEHPGVMNSSPVPFQRVTGKVVWLFCRQQ